MTDVTSTEPLWPQLTVIVAVVASHMSMPNHWLPYSLVGRAHSWTLRKVLVLTFLGALGHVTNTILISLLISEIGGALISHEKYRLLSSSILLLGGVYYLYTYTVQRKRWSCCSQHNPQESSQAAGAVSKSLQQGGDSTAVRRTAEISVVMLTALSPCVGSMPVLVSILAPPVKLSTVLAAGAVLLGTSAVVMCCLVAISYVGAATLDFGKIRRHERLMLGLGLLALAGLTFFVFAGAHGHHAHGHHAHGHHAHGKHVHGNHVHDHDHDMGSARGVHVPSEGVTERINSQAGNNGYIESHSDYNDKEQKVGHVG